MLPSSGGMFCVRKNLLLAEVIRSKYAEVRLISDASRLHTRISFVKSAFAFLEITRCSTPPFTQPKAFLLETQFYLAATLSLLWTRLHYP